MNTKRKHEIKIRMNDQEYIKLKENVQKTGTSIQRYGLDALLTTKITSKEEIDELKQINVKFSSLLRIEKGIGNNINQISRKVNCQNKADIETIQQLSDEIHSLIEGRDKLWLLIRQLVSPNRHIKH